MCESIGHWPLWGRCPKEKTTFLRGTQKVFKSSNIDFYLLYKQKILVQRYDKDSGGKGFYSCLKLPIALNEEEHQNEDTHTFIGRKSEFLIG